MNLLLTLSLILFSCAVLALCLYLVNKGKYPDMKAREARRFSKWGVILSFITWIFVLVYLTTFVDSALAKSAIIILGVGVAVATEGAQIKAFKERGKKSVEDTQW